MGEIENQYLAESKNYYIKGNYEDADLYRKSDNKFICCVGSFYGETEDAVIDKNEKFCVTVGCGVIVYRLKEPFRGYSYDKITDQWYEFGRGPENIYWAMKVRQISDDEVEIIDEEDNVQVLKIQL